MKHWIVFLSSFLFEFSFPNRIEIVEQFILLKNPGYACAFAKSTQSIQTLAHAIGGAVGYVFMFERFTPNIQFHIFRCK